MRCGTEFAYGFQTEARWALTHCGGQNSRLAALRHEEVSSLRSPSTPNLPEAAGSNAKKGKQMCRSLKPLDQQVMVITDACNSIGLATAQGAARRGAKLLLAACNKNAMRNFDLPDSGNGAQVIVVPCDFADRGQFDRLADDAIRHFGTIDTWVNNFAVSIPINRGTTGEDHRRRLPEASFWGIYRGSRAALPHLQRNGGALINVATGYSIAAPALPGIFDPSTHAIKGFTDALRVEIQEVDRAPVSVTLIQIADEDPTCCRRAREYMGAERDISAAAIDASRVAQAILDAAENPTRLTKVAPTIKPNPLEFSDDFTSLWSTI